MRNTLLLAVLCLGLYSCEKDYTCECKSATDSTANTTFAVNSVRENDARRKCTDYQETINISQQKAMSCKLID